MKPLLLLLVVLSISTLARADDQTQSVQQALKEKGFYYRTVDGKPGPETEAAIRRYQIRQGLEVTGKLDDQTLSSLNLAAGAQSGNAIEAVPPPTGQPSDSQPAAAQTPSADIVQSDHDMLRSQPQPPAPAQPPDDQPAQAPPSDDQRAPQPPIQPYAGQSIPPEYAQFFRKTPYEIAPPVVQRSTVQQAQQRLARQGFYRGVADGELSDSLSSALVAYQRDAGLRPTGRLDMETLDDMNLLPRRHLIAAPPEFYPPAGPYAPGPVYRGIWIH